MSKKKNKKKKTGPPQPSVRLSQCMIVKNEEKNIEKALSWAKEVAFEQIVVDTGSTDRTVELAEIMGAKVYHFEWIDDFSAAKNFAMDQAKGNWIAILDADEYMPPEDVKELMSLLRKIQGNPKLLAEFDSVNCSWLQIDDQDKVFAVLTQQRVFRNRPDLRYEGRIHEAVRLRNNHINAENLRIMHTGYAKTAYNEADKMERNIRMLRCELERDPTNPHTILYLADSIKAAGTEEAREEAQQLYLKALASEEHAEPEIKRLAYDFLIPRFSKEEDKKEEAIRLCGEAIAELPSHIDYYYYRAVIQNQKGKFNEALDDLYKCEAAFSKGEGTPETRVLMPVPILLFYQMIVSAQGLGDTQTAEKYMNVIDTLISGGKDRPEVLGPYMVALLQQGVSEDVVLEKLTKTYDLGEPKDLLFIARTAKDYGAVLFASMVMDIAREVMVVGD